MTVVATEGTCMVEVRLRDEFLDAVGSSALAQLQHAGFPGARSVRTSMLYEISGPLSSSQVTQAAKDLLADGVTQEFKIVSRAPVLNGMNHWRVEVWLKPSVTDPVGESVRRAIGELGLPEPLSVRCGTAYRILGKSSRNVLERAVRRALANPVIHTFEVSEAYD